MSDPIQEAQRLGQAIWYDNIRRGLLTSGELQRLIEQGVTGVTSNPTIFEKAVAGSTDYDEALSGLGPMDKSVQEAYESLAIQDIQDTADLLRPVYERTNAADGYISLEVSPRLAHDTEATVAEAERLFAALGRRNAMIKVPATPEGIPAVRRLIGKGININITLIFSLDAYEQVREAYIAGLEDLERAGGDLSSVASVASFFVSRVDTAVDNLLEERISQGRDDLKALLGKAANANAKLAYEAFTGTFGSQRFAALRSKRARVQRPLWASTGTKNPAYSDVLYIEPLIGPDTVNTMPPATLTAFLEHGTVAATIEQGVDEARQTVEELEAAGISMEQVTAKLLDDGVRSFADSFDKLLANIDEKRAKLLAAEHAHPGVSIGDSVADVETALEDFRQRNLVGRIWQKDHTVWKPDPKEITDRLGWLTVTDMMGEQVPALEAFANEVREAGFRHVVLLGMGGSSLGPEVLRQTFGSRSGYPELLVLDSTVPAWIQAVTDSVDLERTLFLVSSKSGGTIETLSGYRHFRELVERAVGAKKTGEHFVAITDPGTPLERLARDERFRRVFLNPSDIGGRYSVLSYFGLVPAVLIGLDVATLLERAGRMREGCVASVPLHDNPGAWLGAVLGTLAANGHDKLTLVTSPSISSFGLWVEQLIAESTGKEGRGIVPVAGEPLVAPASYADDRLFVYLRLDGDDNAAPDAAVEALQSTGQPVVRLDLKDRYDLGAEFFRWEFATAVAGAHLGIHPFDQPNVQGAKDQTSRVLQEYRASGGLPQPEAADSLNGLLSQAGPGSYLAIMAYIHPMPEVEQALGKLRRTVTDRHRIATTVGYGPRFLHSTGQLHKGGPETGLFLQLVEEHTGDLPIPGEPYTFGVLADAQALGDFQELQAFARPVARNRLGSDHGASILKMAEELG